MQEHCQALLQIKTQGFPAWQGRSKTHDHVSMRGSLELILSTHDKAPRRAEEHISWVEVCRVIPVHGGGRG